MKDDDDFVVEVSKVVSNEIATGFHKAANNIFKEAYQAMFEEVEEDFLYGKEEADKRRKTRAIKKQAAEQFDKDLEKLLDDK